MPVSGLFASYFVMGHAMSYCRVRLSFVAPCCGLSELAIETAELKRWLASVARLHCS